LKGEGADVVFECAGYLPAIPEGLGLVRKSGTFCEVGHFIDVGSFEFNPVTMLMERNLRVEAIYGSRAEHFKRAVPLMERGDLPLSDLVSHVLPLSRVKDGFEALDGTYKLGSETVFKIAVGSEA
jgi:threonine dehydrogenase-like Zn-dependent dehydrogenase